MEYSLKIGIDARSLHYEGVGRYTRELIKHLSQIDSENEYIVYFSSKKYLEEESIRKPNFYSVVLPITIYDIHKQPLLGYRIYKDRLDIFHATDHWVTPFYTSCPLVITVHDTLIKTGRKCLPYTVMLYGTFITRIAMTVADRILTVSDFTSNEIARFYPAMAGKISRIYNGVGSEFTPQSLRVIGTVKKKYGLPERYILYVGSLKEHKNIPRLIQAFSHMPVRLRDDIGLVIASRLESRFSSIERLPERLGIEKSVKFIGYLPNSDLPGLYSGATAAVIPSLNESFGLSAVEAMACGIPVTVSGIGALSEVCGEAALYFDPMSVKDIGDKIMRILTDSDLRKRLSDEGIKRSKSFSWDVAASKTLSAYLDLTRRVSDENTSCI